MAKEIVEQKSFQERMRTRIKESIGELMTDEELKTLIVRGIDEAFFKEGSKEAGWRTIATPPLMQSILKELLNEKVTVAVQEYIKENNEWFMEEIKKAFTENLSSTFIRAIHSMFHSALSNFQSNIEQAIESKTF